MRRLDVRLLPNQNDLPTRRALPRVLGRHGGSKVIRVDPDTPFGGVGPRGFSRLSVGWRRRGIRVEFGRPAHPEDNAAHEQLHGVYQTEVAAAPAGHPPAQQHRADRCQASYNQLRPHEALGRCHRLDRNDAVGHGTRSCDEASQPRWPSSTHLNCIVPAEHYRPSPRRLPKRLPVWIVPAAWCQRRVSPDGRLDRQGRQRFIRRTFGGEIIGLQRQQARV